MSLWKKGVAASLAFSLAFSFTPVHADEYEVYDGPAIKRELFEQNGLEAPKNALALWFGETDDGVMLYEILVYNDEAKEPLIREKVEKVYLYAQI